MSKQSVDLFHDPGWPTDMPVGQPTVDWRRRTLLASIALVGLLICSMALPWFRSAETPSWTPFSHWLDLGWSPGTQHWGFLLLGLALGVAVGTGVALRCKSMLVMMPLVALATCLLVVTLLEASAHLSVDPGPDLQADYGALLGTGTAVVLWIGLALALFLGPKE